jgi:hypothetical protein
MLIELALSMCISVALLRKRRRQEGRPVKIYTLFRRSIKTMKALLAICMLVTASFVWAGENLAPTQSEAGVVRGEVIEVQDVESYTYLLLKTSDGEVWAAVIKTTVSKGETVTIQNAIVMKNFESKALKKTFSTILFGTLGGSVSTAPGASTAGGSASSGHALGSAFKAIPSKKLDTINDAHIPKASGANARTVAEIIKKGVQLKEQTVLVRGKVVKYNPEIMGKNWIHLRDGSGSAKDNTNDILVTTASQAKVGDVVTVKGIVRTDKDFGAGYAYKVLIEEATLQ